MKVKVISFTKDIESNTDLNKNVFGLPMRKDILQRVVEWQRARKQAGTHNTLTVSEISGTTKKPFNQKGTGNARQGSLRSPHMRGGAVVFGPKTRSHAYDMPKKVRKLGLKTALSHKAAEGKLKVIDSLSMKSPKTKEIIEKLNKLGLKNVLFIDGEKTDVNLTKALRNLEGIDILPQIGANVYDILKHDNLVITVDAVKLLEERLV